MEYDEGNVMGKFELRGANKGMSMTGRRFIRTMLLIGLVAVFVFVV